MSTKTKSIIALMIALFVVLIIGTTRVEATEGIIIEGTPTKTTLDALPDTIEVNLKESEYNKVDVYNQIATELEKQGIKIQKCDENAEYKDSEITLSVSGVDIETKSLDVAILKWRSENFNGNQQLSGSSIARKTIKIKFCNSNDYTESEQQKVDNIIKKINNTVVVVHELDQIENGYFNKTIEKTLEPLKQAGYTLVDGGGYGGGDLVFTSVGGRNTQIYKNDVYYGFIGIEIQTQAKLTIPSTVKDTETAIINYTTPIIKKFVEASRFEENNTVGCVEYKAGDGIILKKYNGEYYRVLNKRTQELIGTILLKKEKATNINNTTITQIGNQNYTGKEIKPSITIKNGKTKLKAGTDYTVSYKNNKNIGTATVTIKGKGNYTGTITKTFKIVVGQTKKVTTKTQDTNSITIKWNKDKAVSGYEVYMSTNKNKGYKKVATISKNSTTSYKKTKLSVGKTYYFKVRAYKTVNKKKKYGDYSSVLTTTTKTKAPSITKLTTSKKKATVKWKKVSGATGYEVYMSTSKNKGYKKIATNTKSSKVSYTKSKLKKNKKYYFKIRTYKTVNGKRIYSSYSSIKSIKVK